MRSHYAHTVAHRPLAWSPDHWAWSGRDQRRHSETNPWEIQPDYIHQTWWLYASRPYTAFDNIPIQSDLSICLSIKTTRRYFSKLSYLASHYSLQITKTPSLTHSGMEKESLLILETGGLPISDYRDRKSNNHNVHRIHVTGVHPDRWQATTRLI